VSPAFVVCEPPHIGRLGLETCCALRAPEVRIGLFPLTTLKSAAIRHALRARADRRQC